MDNGRGWRALGRLRWRPSFSDAWVTVDRRESFETDEGGLQRMGQDPLSGPAGHLLPEGEGRTPPAPCLAAGQTEFCMRQYPRAASRRGFGKSQSGGPHAGFAFGNWVWVVHGVHAPGWRSTRAARSSPDDVRIRQASAFALTLRPGRGRCNKTWSASGTDPTAIATIKSATGPSCRPYACFAIGRNPDARASPVDGLARSSREG